MKEITKHWIDQLNPYENRSKSKKIIVPGLKNNFKSTKQARINFKSFFIVFRWWCKCDWLGSRGIWRDDEGCYEMISLLVPLSVLRIAARPPIDWPKIQKTGDVFLVIGTFPLLLVMYKAGLNLSWADELIDLDQLSRTRAYVFFIKIGKSIKNHLN